MSVKISSWIAILFSIVLWGCYPKGAEYAEELDLVYTNYSSQFDFKSKMTYSIPDSVIRITGEVYNDPDGNGKPTFLSSVYSTAILSEIKENMSANGWTLVDKNNNPDVIMLVSSMTTTNIYYYYDWAYWDWWYPGYYPYWGWYYPGWYYPTYVEGYRSGSIFIQMVDSKQAPASENVPVVWNCVLNGLAEGDVSNLTARIQLNISKAFAQSQYLKK